MANVEAMFVDWCGIIFWVYGGGVEKGIASIAK
jgi:hypothetical protein